MVFRFHWWSFVSCAALSPSRGVKVGSVHRAMVMGFPPMHNHLHVSSGDSKLKLFNIIFGGARISTV